MARQKDSRFDELPLDLSRRIDAIARHVEQRWWSGQTPDLLEFLHEVPERARASLLEELLYVEVTARRRCGESLSLEDYVDRFPDERELVAGVLEESLNDSAMGRSLDSVNNDRQSQLPRIPGYRFERQLGKGAMGVVYLAQHEQLKRAVAIKMVASTLDPEQSILRLRAEAEVIARLDHPNIVRIFEVGEYDGETFLALEYVSGEGNSEVRETQLFWAICREW